MAKQITLTDLKISSLTFFLDGTGEWHIFFSYQLVDAAGVNYTGGEFDFVPNATRQAQIQQMVDQVVLGVKQKEGL